MSIPFVKNIVTAFDIETKEEMKIGEEGELCICTPSMMWGYVNNESETKHIIKQHDDGNMWVHTGDLGFIDEDGFIHISVGKIDYRLLEKMAQDYVSTANAVKKTGD